MLDLQYPQSIVENTILMYRMHPLREKKTEESKQRHSVLRIRNVYQVSGFSDPGSRVDKIQDPDPDQIF